MLFLPSSNKTKQQPSVTQSCEFHTWFTSLREIMWQTLHPSVLFFFFFCCFCSENELSTSRLLANSSEKIFRKNLPAYLQGTQEGWKVNATLVSLIRWVRSSYQSADNKHYWGCLMSRICWHFRAKRSLCSQTPLLNVSSSSCLWAWDGTAEV